MGIYNLTGFLSQVKLSQATALTIPEAVVQSFDVPDGFTPLSEDEVNGQLVIRYSNKKNADSLTSTYSTAGVSNDWIINFINAISDNSTVVNVDTLLTTTRLPTVTLNKYNLMSLKTYVKYKISFDLKIKNQTKSGLCFIPYLNGTDQCIISFNDMNDFSIVHPNGTVPFSTNLTVQTKYNFTIEYDNTKSTIKINDTELSFNYPDVPIHFGFVTNNNVTKSGITMYDVSE